MKVTKKIESILYTLLCIWAVLISVFCIWCSFKAEGLLYLWSVVLGVASLVCAVTCGCAVFDCLAEIDGKASLTKISVTDLCVTCLTVCLFVLNALIINKEVEPFSDDTPDIICEYSGNNTGVRPSFIEFDNMKISGSSLKYALDLFEDDYIVVIRTNKCDDEKYAVLCGRSNYEVTFDEVEEDLQYLTKEEFDEMFEGSSDKYLIRTAACAGKLYTDAHDEFNIIGSSMYISNSSHYVVKIIRDRQGAIAGLYAEELGS